jgi:hypothetical protein
MGCNPAKLFLKLKNMVHVFGMRAFHSSSMGIATEECALDLFSRRHDRQAIVKDRRLAKFFHLWKQVFLCARPLPGVSRFREFEVLSFSTVREDEDGANCLVNDTESALAT